MPCEGQNSLVLLSPSAEGQSWASWHPIGHGTWATFMTSEAEARNGEDGSGPLTELG